MSTNNVFEIPTPIFIEMIISIVVYGYLLAVLTIRRCRLANVAYHRINNYPKTLFACVILIAMMAIFYIASIISCYTGYFWVALPNENLCLILLLPVITLTYLVRMMFYDYNHHLQFVPYVHKYFWMMTSILFVSLTFYIWIYKPLNSSQIDLNLDKYLCILKTVISVILTILLFIYCDKWVKYEEDDLENKLLTANASIFNQESIHKKSGTLSKRVSSISNYSSIRNEDDKSKSKITLKTEVNKVKQKYNSLTGKSEFWYNIEVSIGNQNYKISKTLKNFQDLERNIEMQSTTTETSSVMLQSLILRTKRDTIKGSFINLNEIKEDDISSTIHILQKFLNNIIENADNINRILITTFLEVAEPEKTYFINMYSEEYCPYPSPNFGQFYENYENNPNITEKPENDEDSLEDEKKSQGAEEQKLPDISEFSKTQAEDIELSPYFEVQITKCRRPPHGDYIEYIIQLQLAEKPEDKWEIIKRYTDFVNLNKEIKKKCLVIPPQLPGKLLLPDQEQLEKRKIGLENYLKIILNEKVFLKVDEVLKFVNLNAKEYGWLLEDETYPFNKYTAKIKMTEVILIKNTPVTYYQIDIYECDLSTVSSATTTKVKSIKKCFKEFEKLHEGLQRRFNTKIKNQEKLPQLPPRYNNFKLKTRIKDRMEGLEKYLNDLFKYENIGDSIAFRRFIGYISPSKENSPIDLKSSNNNTNPSSNNQPNPNLTISIGSMPSKKVDFSPGMDLSNSPSSFANLMMRKKYRD